MVQDLRLIAIVLLLAALAYVLYLWSKRKDQIPCPECGARVNIYADKCPHCGHQKGEDVEESVDTDTVSESAADDVDYDALVKDHTIPAVKDAMQEQDLDPEKVLAAEKRHKDRVTLKDWLEEHMAA